MESATAYPGSLRLSAYYVASRITSSQPENPSRKRTTMKKIQTVYVVQGKTNYALSISDADARNSVAEFKRSGPIPESSVSLTKFVPVGSKRAYQPNLSSQVLSPPMTWTDFRAIADGLDLAKKKDQLAFLARLNRIEFGENAHDKTLTGRMVHEALLEAEISGEEGRPAWDTLPAGRQDRYNRIAYYLGWARVAKDLPLLTGDSLKMCARGLVRPSSEFDDQCAEIANRINQWLQKGFMPSSVPKPTELAGPKTWPTVESGEGFTPGKFVTDYLPPLGERFFNRMMELGCISRDNWNNGTDAGKARWQKAAEEFAKGRETWERAGEAGMNAELALSAALDITTFESDGSVANVGDWDEMLTEVKRLRKIATFPMGFPSDTINVPVVLPAPLFNMPRISVEKFKELIGPVIQHLDETTTAADLAEEINDWFQSNSTSIAYMPVSSDLIISGEKLYYYTVVSGFWGNGSLGATKWEALDQHWKKHYERMASQLRFKSVQDARQEPPPARSRASKLTPESLYAVLYRMAERCRASNGYALTYDNPAALAAFEDRMSDGVKEELETTCMEIRNILREELAPDDEWLVKVLGLMNMRLGTTPVEFAEATKTLITLNGDLIKAKAELEVTALTSKRFPDPEESGQITHYRKRVARLFGWPENDDVTRWIETGNTGGLGFIAAGQKFVRSLQMAYWSGEQARKKSERVPGPVPSLAPPGTYLVSLSGVELKKDDEICVTIRSRGEPLEETLPRIRRSSHWFNRTTGEEVEVYDVICGQVFVGSEPDSLGKWEENNFLSLFAGAHEITNVYAELLKRRWAKRTTDREKDQQRPILKNSLWRNKRTGEPVQVSEVDGNQVFVGEEGSGYEWRSWSREDFSSVFASFGESSVTYWNQLKTIWENTPGTWAKIGTPVRIKGTTNKLFIREFSPASGLYGLASGQNMVVGAFHSLDEFEPWKETKKTKNKKPRTVESTGRRRR